MKLIIALLWLLVSSAYAVAEQPDEWIPVLRIPMADGRASQASPGSIRTNFAGAFEVVPGVPEISRQGLIRLSVNDVEERKIGDLPQTATGDPEQALPAIFLLALFGGFILNFMPCVLPVLSVKLFEVVNNSGRSRREIRLGFLASAAGVLCAFLVLAGSVIAAKAIGLTVGWGVQFQHPVFLAVLALICVIFTANLCGLFEIQLPATLADGAGNFSCRSGFKGDFFHGVFATVLATPCSAPFLGPAVAFAMTRGPTEILAVFMALAIGLALPYLLIALIPGLVNLLPRPGQWMIVLRRILGVALAATSVWLISVLSSQMGGAAALLIGTCLGVLVFVLWMRRRVLVLMRIKAVVPVVAFSVLALCFAAFMPSAPTVSSVTAVNTFWRNFDATAIPRLVAEGHVVFVDVTADWCITCQVNKSAVLGRAPVATALARGGVVAMTADWTRPSDEIAAYLASFGRYGIPFNVIYGPHAPDGIALPVILTSNIVLGALSKAVGGNADKEESVSR